MLIQKKIFLRFIQFSETETERDRGRGREREREREGDTESEAASRLWAVSTEPDTSFELTDHERRSPIVLFKCDFIKDLFYATL